MSSDALTYTRPDDPLWKRCFMRSIENLSGRRRLLPIYDHWRKEIAGRSPRMWTELLDMIGTRLEVKAPVDWSTRLPEKSLVMIANHPFGIADGIAILALAERVGRPYRVILNSDFMRMPEIRPLGLPIDFSQTKQAMATNLETRAETRRLLKEGVTIVIFPAGGVATAENLYGKAEDLPWKQFVVRLIQQSDAAVLPIYFEGQNSPLFHFVSRYSLMLRLSLLICEFRHKVGSTIEAVIGAPVRCSELMAQSNGGAFIDELYLLVHRLAPGAAGADRKALLPRPAEERRRYPWDPPLPRHPRGRRHTAAEADGRRTSGAKEASQAW